MTPAAMPSRSWSPPSTSTASSRQRRCSAVRTKSGYTRRRARASHSGSASRPHRMKRAAPITAGHAAGLAVTEGAGDSSPGVPPAGRSRRPPTRAAPGGRCHFACPESLPQPFRRRPRRRPARLRSRFGQGDAARPQVGLRLFACESRVGAALGAVVHECVHLRTADRTVDDSHGLPRRVPRRACRHGRRDTITLSASAAAENTGGRAQAGRGEGGPDGSGPPSPRIRLRRRVSPPGASRSRRRARSTLRPPGPSPVRLLPPARPASSTSPRSSPRRPSRT